MEYCDTRISSSFPKCEEDLPTAGSWVIPPRPSAGVLDFSPLAAPSTPRRSTDGPCAAPWPPKLYRYVPSMSPHLRIHNNHEQDICLTLPCWRLHKRNHHRRRWKHFRPWSVPKGWVQSAKFLDGVKCRSGQVIPVSSGLKVKIQSQPPQPMSQSPSAVALGFVKGEKSEPTKCSQSRKFKRSLVAQEARMHVELVTR